MTREIKNARIESTMLGYEDHGILTCFLYLDYGGGGHQGFGGYAFDDYREEVRERVPVAFGAQFISSILKTVGATSWEKLPGQHLRVDATHDRVYRIGHLLREEWFDPAQLGKGRP